MRRPALLVLVSCSLAMPALAASPESLGLFDFRSSRFSLFDDLADARPDGSFDPQRDGRHHLFPVAGDWNGDGLTDLGFYDAKGHAFALFADRRDGAPDAQIPVRTGRRSWLRPVVGDWNGDGRDDLGLWDRYARRFSLLSSEGDGRVVRVVQLSDRRSCELRPFAGDWDGDGVDELGLFDARERTIHLLSSKATGGRAVVLRSNESAPHLRPVSVDLNGDGRDELALFDRKTRRFALLADLADGATDGSFDVSAVPGEHLAPLAGRWNAAPAGGGGGGGGDVPDTAACQPAAGVSPALAAFELQLLTEVNARRAAGAVCGQEGSFPPVPPLAMDPALRCAARLHALDMAARSVVTSIGANGSSPESRIAAAGYAARFVGENVAGTLPDPASVVSAWMANGIQCSLVLESGFEHAGVGLVDRPGAQRFFWALDFAAPQ